MRRPPQQKASRPPSMRDIPVQEDIERRSMRRPKNDRDELANYNDEDYQKWSRQHMSVSQEQ